jgi:REP element-mobilizing transposase RayT
MTRTARALSESGAYHAMARGIDKAQLFYDDEDRYAFLERLVRYQERYHFSLYAYCLMGNHVHLLIQLHSGGLPEIMKSLLLSYSHWFNTRYRRSGYLFGDRYKSEPVNDDAYLLAAIRYIHKNPQATGQEGYPWTSYDEIMNHSHLVDAGYVLGLFAEDDNEARRLFDAFLQRPADDSCVSLESSTRRYMDDAEAIQLILETSLLDSCGGVCAVERGERNRIIAVLRREGMSVRQICRLTGLTRGIVQKIDF